MKLPELVRIPLVVLLMSACSLAPVAQPTSNPVSPATATPTATVVAVATATAPPATHDPTPTESVPPRGFLRADDDPVEGQLGSWCYEASCADSPAFPKSTLPAFDTKPGISLTFEFAEGDAFAFVRVRYSTESDLEPVMDLASGGTYVEPDTTATQGPLLTSFTFGAPPRGDWVLDISVQFPGELGNAPYSWHATVE